MLVKWTQRVELTHYNSHAVDNAMKSTKQNKKSVLGDLWPEKFSWGQCNFHIPTVSTQYLLDIDSSFTAVYDSKTEQELSSC